jgi:hypothetical protein
MIVKNNEESYEQDDLSNNLHPDREISGLDDPEDEQLDDELIDDDDDLITEEDWDDDLTDEADLDTPYPGEKSEPKPDEIPEKHESEHEESEYPSETEYEKQGDGNDASYSEQTDVTPPTPHEFPSVGNAQTDFVSRPHGRTTGRMVGHEPGTEGI